MAQGTGRLAKLKNIKKSKFLKSSINLNVNSQVESSERVIVYGMEYLKNLTNILAHEPKRNIANYMLWKVALSTISYMDKSARDLIEAYSRKVSGKTEDTPRWKTCVSTAAGSFSAAVGKLYVNKHFNEGAKDKMMEMVHDIKDEFKMILDQVQWMDEGEFLSQILSFMDIMCL